MRTIKFPLSVSPIEGGRKVRWSGSQIAGSLHKGWAAPSDDVSPSKWRGYSGRWREGSDSPGDSG
uniref:Uncharacterized protein n=1 Tax=Ficus carica TaxID=3494 RepID=A0AA87Z484_FICCA|nr:hypothetical protein TIFTF001_049182 [Ficus carica]GMN25093.1 hypothetical protein TIFTF001_049191 [Ficus carica]